MLWNLARVPTGQAHLAHPASPVSIRHRFWPSPARAAGYYASADFLQRDSGSLTAAGSPGVTTKTVSDIPNGYFWFNLTTSPWYTHGSPHPLRWGCRLFQTLRTSVTGCVLSFPTLRARHAGVDSHHFVLVAALRL